MTSPSMPALAAQLHSDCPAADRAGKLSLYGRFVGDWTMDVLAFEPDGTTRRATGSIHFGWILQGRAIQDVWRTPGPRPGVPDDPSRSVMYGTTLRIYDPGLDAWHIVWVDPVRGFHSRQIGRAVGDDIVQEGETAEGVRNRWTFTEITPSSFHWIGEHAPDGRWSKTVEFFARRA